jgi:hypothetical protein
LFGSLGSEHQPAIARRLSQPTRCPRERESGRIALGSTFFERPQSLEVMPPALAGLSHPIGSSALRAAGVIHADVRRGEFRGEFNSAADPKTFKTEKGFKEKG